LKEAIDFNSVSFWKGFDGNTFSGNPLDRLGNIRKNVDLLVELRERPNSLFLPFQKLSPLLSREKKTLAWLSWSSLKAALGEITLEGTGKGKEYKENSLVLLGKRDDIHYYAINVSHLTTENTFSQEYHFVEARASAATLPYEEAGIVSQARALLDWHSRHPHCAKCGELTVLTEGGNKRTCGGCKTPHYPRTDSVVIVMIIADRKRDNSEEIEQVCLLATRTGGYKAMFTCLSGFIEIGESLEEAIKREVEEESGINLDVQQIWYHSSQPWPFPSQLMIGCLAMTNYAQATVDVKELGEARWFNRQQVKEMLERSQGPLGDSTEERVPPPLAIAHQLIKFWANAK